MPDPTQPQSRWARHALEIWRAAVDAVRSDALVREAVRVKGPSLTIGEAEFDLRTIDRIVVVGGGKAGAGMAAGLEQALGPELLATKRVSGWLNVPADCVRPLKAIHLHPARPPGVNEPTEAGAEGAREILLRVANAGPNDLCICLFSGGASALLPAPVDGITLADKLAVTRFLSAAGANIAELNTVRKQLSKLKGGGLLRACRAGALASLIISDVIGDPLDIVASGPTVLDPATPQDALAVLDRFGARRGGVPASVFAALEARQSAPAPQPAACRAHTFVIGNNAVAVDAAGQAAERLGYEHALTAARELEGPAEEVGRHLADMAWSMRRAGPTCLITGGEPVVKLCDASVRGLGGRNQQLVLAALQRLGELAAAEGAPDGSWHIALLSGGTDGEDGPTDAAGAWLDEATLVRARVLGLDAGDFLRRNDAYHFFERVGGLIVTGPTHTNVCDVRVAVVERAA